jgi:hypothetical protein
MRAAQKLLGALTIGGGECPARGWRWRKLISLQVAWNGQKQCKKQEVSHTYWLKNHPKHRFYSKVLIKIYFQGDFWGIHELKNFLLLAVMLSYSCLNFRKSYMHPVPQIRVNPKLCGYINLCCRAARSHIWLLRRPREEREGPRHATAVVGSSGPTLRKS